MSARTSVRALTTAFDEVVDERDFDRNVFGARSR
jgi:hypothetical protein